MKKVILSSILLASLVLPWACSDNSTPAQPSGPPLGGGAPTATSTGTVVTATPTNSFTPAAGTFTNTPTPTPAVATPPYLGEWPTAASPNGFYLDPSGPTSLYVVEGDGIVSQYAIYNRITGALISGTAGNLITNALAGGTTVLLNNPLAMCFTPLNSGLWVLVDQTAGGGAMIYTGSTYLLVDFNSGNSWGTQAFNKPQGFASDGRYIYLADTGNAYVEEFDPFESGNPLPLHRWGGYTPNPFKKPVAVATDPTGNIWAADNGYNPPIISEFTSSGVTWIRQFPTVPNCVVNGMAVTVDALLNDVVYISDSFHREVQEYDRNGVLLRSWTENQGPHQYLPFVPGPIALDATNNQILVSDQANATIEVFGP